MNLLRRNKMGAVYREGMNLTPYLRKYNYFPDFTKFLFGELADIIRKRGYLLSTELVLIYVWKNFWRTNLIGASIKATPKQVEVITKGIFRINHDDKWKIIDILRELAGLLGENSLAIKVASCILTIVFPDKYGIIDRRILNTLNIPYLDLETGANAFFRMREIAKEQQRITGELWTPRMVDMALWQFDRIHNH
jgi:hypothetical protein